MVTLQRKSDAPAPDPSETIRAADWNLVVDALSTGAESIYTKHVRLANALLATPVGGTLEYDGDYVYWTDALGNRHQIAEAGTAAPGAAPNDAAYVTLATHTGLSAERVLAAGSGLSLTDGGADGSVTLAVAATLTDKTLVRPKLQAARVGKHVHVTADYLLASDAGRLTVDASAGPITITLPACANHAEREVWVKRVDTSANDVLVRAQTGETIDGTPSIAVPEQYQALTLWTQGTEWLIV